MLDSGVAEKGKYGSRDVVLRQMLWRGQQHAGNIEGDIALTDEGDMPDARKWGRGGVRGVLGIPVDERKRRDAVL